MNSYIKLGIAALLPVFLSVIFYALDEKTRFGKWNNRIKQVIWGISFGILAIVGNEWSIPLDEALVNCRDAAVISGGLFFGGPAGIIAGVIGGTERWMAAEWGAGYFTRVACSVSTILAGIFAALLRKYIYEDKKPTWPHSLGVGIVIEVFHLLMVFITNMDAPRQAMGVIRACTGPMLIANGLSVMLSSLLIYLIFQRKEEVEKKKNRKAGMSGTIQKWLFFAIIFAFIATTAFVYVLQNQTAILQANKLLTTALQETVEDIRDTTDGELLYIAEQLKSTIKPGERDYDLAAIAKSHGIAEINIIDDKGIIVESNCEEYIGYNMASGLQSAKFLILLGDQESYVQEYGPVSFDPAISRKYAGVKCGSGFLQVGYNAAQFQLDIDQEIIDITKNRHVGYTGRIVIVDEDYKVVSAPKTMSPESVEEALKNIEFTDDTDTFQTRIMGEKYYLRYRIAEGYYIISLMPEEEVMQMRNMSLYINSFMEVLIFAILFGIIYIFINRSVVDKIQNINQSLNKIASGHLDEVVNVRDNDEFDSLSDDINSTVDTLKEYIDEASKKIEAELEMAKEIQKSALPSVFPAFPKRKDLDIFASMNAAKEVGGDFYDFYLTNNDTLNFLVADVSGKGIPAAMFMMRAKTELKSLTEAQLLLCDVFTRGNHKLCEGNDAGMFVTVWQGAIDLKSGIVQYVNAGHNPPVVRRGNGEFEFLKCRAGFILAGMDGIKYRIQELELESGDIIFLYTDGVTEATNKNMELYGDDRLLHTLNEAEFSNMQELCQFVKTDVDAFVGDAPQFDDITMVAFQYIGQSPIPSIHFEEAQLEDIRKVTEFVERELEKLDCPMKLIIQMSIAIDEIFSNIVRHGYPNHAGPVTVEVIKEEAPRSVSIRFSDHALPYNPITAMKPDITLSAEERKIGGLGIYMVKQTMDDMKYKYENDQNILTIYKRY